MNSNGVLKPQLHYLILLIAATLGLSCNSPSQGGRSYQPNFLFILVDDLGYMDIGAYNPNTFYETPNVDRLASEGMRFTDAYAAAPVCSPTRASIMTGSYPGRLNTTDWFGAPQPETAANHSTGNRLLLPASYVEELPLEEITMAEAFRDAGYETFFAGKWHLGTEGSYPEDHGFSINKGGWERGGPYGRGRYFPPYDNPRLEDGPEGEHLPARLAEETAQFISETRDKPFLAFLSFYSVHTPLMTRSDLEAKYERKRLGVPEDEWGVEGERKVRLVQNHAIYAGMVEAMDLAVGRLLQQLEESGLAEKTVVIFMSDNGGLSTSEGHPTSNLPLRAGKGWMYEGGIREPMIIKWPGVTSPGATSSISVTSTDFYPTMLDMADVSSNEYQHPDGVSLVPLLEGKNRLDRDALYWHYPHYGNQGGSPSAAVRKGAWKLIEFFEDNRVELYNLQDDIGEQTNLSSREPEKVEELRSMLHDWYLSVDAQFPSANSATTAN
ncbi:MAG: sulfatase [Bacteroidetes bacterium]|nr:sulfatase [Bacteroidota bacterium]